MSTSTIRIESGRAGVARITLARPEKHNALNIEMIRELTAAAQSLGNDPNVRVIVLTGDGGTFCAGGDLDWMRGQIDMDRSARLAEATELANMLHALDTLPKPLIGRVQGAAFGGGVGLMAICDIIVAVDSAKFALTEVRLGLIPATIVPFLIRRIGECGARRFVLNAKVLTAAEAMAAGLVSVAVPSQELDSAIEIEISAALECAPGAVAAAKSICATIARNPGGDYLAWSAEQLVGRWTSAEAEEGLGCFFERRRPSWRVKT